MPDSRLRVVIVVALLAVAVAFGLRPHRLSADTEITPALRAGALRFAPEVAPGDRAWIRGAIASARPEARRLIDEVDGLVTVRTDLHAPGVVTPGAERAIGLARFQHGRAEVSLDARALDGERALDRNVVVLHELGHVVDYALVEDDLVRQLDGGIPAAGPCVALADFGACTAVPERFADTFAKWALRGRFSLAGSGYGIPTPPSLEDWGMPLARLATELSARAG